eukprot:1769-Heterococcus_DN1.PRE.2
MHAHLPVVVAQRRLLSAIDSILCLNSCHSASFGDSKLNKVNRHIHCSLSLCDDSASSCCWPNIAKFSPVIKVAVLVGSTANESATGNCVKLACNFSLIPKVMNVASYPVLGSTSGIVCNLGQAGVQWKHMSIKML